ncbi:nuclear transport factor 2 family protein [Devosia salina]|uniref:Nuclear transport factor 2 family protein n=1 Tax=Devosia salina TaxID=2860336 RepID=A0ABX8WHG2_9HYPH|nr:nuclear transport factor 2 family protein [Devosia salina]QYO76416.1 nuclear transport factor 2 family protein [Devosia salina]
MTDLSPFTLPQPLARYFERRGNVDAATIFAPAATVTDEGHTYRGPTEIGHWLRSVEQRYRPRYRILGAETHDRRTVVTFEVSGTFPGSPAVLRQAFRLDNAARIESLETL